MVVKRQCSFCADEIEPGTGSMFVKRDGSVFFFCSSSCRRQQLHLGRVGHRLKWTRAHSLKRVVAAPVAASAASAPASSRAPRAETMAADLRVAAEAVGPGSVSATEAAAAEVAVAEPTEPAPAPGARTRPRRSRAPAPAAEPESEAASVLPKGKTSGTPRPSEEASAAPAETPPAEKKPAKKPRAKRASPIAASETDSGEKRSS
jgi:large subunit ribosomal protein L24e